MKPDSKLYISKFVVFQMFSTIYFLDSYFSPKNYELPSLTFTTEREGI